MEMKTIVEIAALITGTGALKYGFSKICDYTYKKDLEDARKRNPSLFDSIQEQVTSVKRGKQLGFLYLLKKEMERESFARSLSESPAQIYRTEQDGNFSEYYGMGSLLDSMAMLRKNQEEFNALEEECMELEKEWDVKTDIPSVNIYEDPKYIDLNLRRVRRIKDLSRYGR
ncbi:MAG: hypothetical protein WCI72_06290 [archaeon]